jgi:hypothetical protein
MSLKRVYRRHLQRIARNCRKHLVRVAGYHTRPVPYTLSVDLWEHSRGVRVPRRLKHTPLRDHLFGVTLYPDERGWVDDVCGAVGVGRLSYLRPDTHEGASLECGGNTFSAVSNWTFSNCEVVIPPLTLEKIQEDLQALMKAPAQELFGQPAKEDLFSDDLESIPMGLHLWTK